MNVGVVNRDMEGTKSKRRGKGSTTEGIASKHHQGREGGTGPGERLLISHSSIDRRYRCLGHVRIRRIWFIMSSSSPPNRKPNIPRKPISMRVSVAVIVFMRLRMVWVFSLIMPILCPPGEDIFQREEIMAADGTRAGKLQ